MTWLIIFYFPPKCIRFGAYSGYKVIRLGFSLLAYYFHDFTKLNHTLWVMTSVGLVMIRDRRDKKVNARNL